MERVTYVWLSLVAILRKYIRTAFKRHIKTGSHTGNANDKIYFEGLYEILYRGDRDRTHGPDEPHVECIDEQKLAVECGLTTSALTLSSTGTEHTKKL